MTNHIKAPSIPRHALIAAVEIMKFWYDHNDGQFEIFKTFREYYEDSDEMQPIREALGKYEDIKEQIE